ncbi:MAG: hypothetical protein IK086_03800 [Clostridia bacterium]|nr:hypothetical protein [Clostridia bacterium]
MGANFNKQTLINAILNASGSKINQNSLKNAADGDISALASQLDEKSRKELYAALENREKAKEILSSKEAREILKKLSGGKGNG